MPVAVASSPKLVPGLTLAKVTVAVVAIVIAVNVEPVGCNVAMLYVPAVVAPAPTMNLLKFVYEPPVPSKVLGTVVPFQTMALVTPVVDEAVIALVAAALTVKYVLPVPVEVYDATAGETVKNTAPDDELLIDVNVVAVVVYANPAEPEMVKEFNTVDVAVKFTTEVPDTARVVNFVNPDNVMLLALDVPVVVPVVDNCTLVISLFVSTKVTACELPVTVKFNNVFVGASRLFVMVTVDG